MNTICNYMDLQEHRVLYWGIDPTAPFLTLGHIKCIYHLFELKTLYNDLELIILIGNATVKLGDPSDKLVARDKHENHTQDIVFLLQRLFYNFDHKIVYNADWLDKLSFHEWLDLCGENSVNRMLKYDYIKRRIDTDTYLPMKEFLYSTIQGYDFWYLNKTFNCTIQYGGHDQLINILQGIKFLEQRGQKGALYPTPLLVDDHNRKISKTTHPMQLLSINTTPIEYRIALNGLSDTVLYNVLHYENKCDWRYDIFNRNKAIFTLIKLAFPYNYYNSYRLEAKCNYTNIKDIYNFISGITNKSKRWTKEHVFIINNNKRFLRFRHKKLFFHVIKI